MVSRSDDLKVLVDIFQSEIHEMGKMQSRYSFGRYCIVPDLYEFTGL